MLQCHGTEDPVIFYKWGTLLADAMKPMNPKYEFKSYEGLKHAVNDQVCAWPVTLNQPFSKSVHTHCTILSAQPP